MHSSINNVFYCIIKTFTYFWEQMKITVVFYCLILKDLLYETLDFRAFDAMIYACISTNGTLS